MPDSAAQVQYRAEYIAGFEQSQSYLRKTVTVECDIKAASAVFLVADTGGATAVTRGLNGLIPGRPDNLNQYTTTLTEWHDKPIRTNFNIYTSQGDGKMIMQKGSLKVMNKRIDQDILAELALATNDTGPAQKGSLSLIVYASTILGNNEVEFDDKITAVISPAFYGYLQQSKEFTNVDYGNGTPLSGRSGSFKWMGINFIVHPNLVGKGTALEKTFMYHRDAIGHACDIENLRVVAGYDEQEDYSFARTSAYMGSKLLQNSGVVVMNHDGSGFAAQ